MSDVALDVEVAEVADLAPDPQNARRHPPAQLEKIARSLDRFGQRKPIVVHRGVVIAGNGTFGAIQKLGWERVAVVRLPDGWTPEEVRAFAIADNRTSDLAEWDYAELVASLGTIGDEDLIAASGFTEEEYDDLIAKLQEGVDPSDPQGIRATPSLDEYGARYADRATRLLICELPNATYIWMMDRLRDLREEMGVDNNAEVVTSLVAERFDEPVGGSPEPAP